MMRQILLPLLKTTSPKIAGKTTNKIFYSLVAVVALFLSTHSCVAPALTLNQPGHYTLGEDITFSPIAADSIISIESSDVTLDLGGWSIIQGNATAGVNGISIAEGLERVSVMNGTIRNVTGIGIVINNLVTPQKNLIIREILFDGCQSRGISSTNVLPLLPIQKIRIENCSFTECLLPATGDSIIFLSATRSVFKNIYIANQSVAIGNKTLFNAGVTLSSIDSILVERFIATGSLIGFNSNNIAASLIKNSSFFLLSGSTTTVFNVLSNNNMYINCIAQSTDAINNCSFFSVAGTDPDIFIGCVSNGMVSSSGIINGFDFANASNQTLIDCIIERASASAGNCTPYRFVNCVNCQLIRCYAFNNRATGATSDMSGFSLDTCTGCLLRDCIAANNAAGQTARGYFFNAGTENNIDNNAAYRNTGTTASVGFTVGSATNSFLRNIALRNGVVLANQFAGFAATQRNVQNINATNSLTQAWTNVGLI